MKLLLGFLLATVFLALTIPTDANKRVYVGNLPFTASEEEIRELFEQYAEVESVFLSTDRTTGRPRGFGYVEMEFDDVDDVDDVGKAIEQLDGKEWKGKILEVLEARPGEGKDKRAK